MYGPRVLVFSSRSGAWAVHPVADLGGSGGGARIMPMPGSVGDAMHANGSVYWAMDDDVQEPSPYLLALDTRAKMFSTVRLLSSMRARYEGNMRVVRTDGGGELRMVALADGLVLDFWRLDRSRSSRGRWVREARREVAHAHGVMGLVADKGMYRPRIMDAAEGFLFLKHFDSHLVFVLDLDAMVLRPLLHSMHHDSPPAVPYRMALQPPFPVIH